MAEALTAAPLLLRADGPGAVVMSADVPSSNVDLRDFHLDVYLLLMLPISVFKEIDHFILQCI